MILAHRVALTVAGLLAVPLALAAPAKTTAAVSKPAAVKPVKLVLPAEPRLRPAPGKPASPAVDVEREIWRHQGVG